MMTKSMCGILIGACVASLWPTDDLLAGKRWRRAWRCRDVVDCGNYVGTYDGAAGCPTTYSSCRGVPYVATHLAAACCNSAPYQVSYGSNVTTGCPATFNGGSAPATSGYPKNEVRETAKPPIPETNESAIPQPPVPAPFQSDEPLPEGSAPQPEL